MEVDELGAQNEESEEEEKEEELSVIPQRKADA
jgi:hypothetical protein